MATLSLGRILRTRLRAAAFFTLFLALAHSAHAGSIDVAWDPNTETDVIGYTLYYGTASGNYTNSMDCGASISCVAINLTAGQRYYFAVRAYNTAGLLSPFSLEVSAVVPQAGTSASLTSPSQGTTLAGSSVQFQWNAGTGVSDYKLSVGGSLGGTNYLNADEGTSLSATVTGLPTNGSAVYVRLWSLISSVWNFKDYAFTAFTTPPVLTATPASVQAGAAITVTVANGPGNPSDWVALVPSSSADGSYVAWKYLNGATTVPSAGIKSATLTFTAPSSGGTYNFRFFANGSFVKLATSGTVTVAPPPPPPPSGISVSATTVNAGDPITVTLTSGPGNVLDWVALYRTGSPNTSYLKWQYLNGLMTPPASGLTTAALQFVAPSTAGTYNVRWLSNNSLTTIATSATITVLPPPPPSATPSATTVSAGAPFNVTLANGPANPADWVALYPASAADSAYIAWEYMNGSYAPPATGSSAATIRFIAPTTPGTYNLRWFANNTFTKLATSTTITVVPPPPPSVTLGASTVNAGSIFTVTVADGPANQLDWVGVYSTAAGDGGYLAWSFMNGSSTMPDSGVTGATLQFVAPTTAGTYNVRWFANNSFTKIAASATLTVQPAQPPAISLSSTTVARGAAFTATVTNGPANPTDWIAMYRTSAVDGAYLAWKFMNDSTLPPSAGTSSATVTFNAPTTPGTYNIRFFANNTFSKLASSATITVP